MEKALIVSSHRKNAEEVALILRSKYAKMETVFAPTSNTAKTILSKDTSISIVIIQTPLSDEFGSEIAQNALETSAGVIMLVKGDFPNEFAAKMENDGVLIFSLSMGKTAFLVAVNALICMHRRLCCIAPREAALSRKLKDIKTINRAKCMLIQYSHMTEEQAHRYIEKLAMDRRATRKEIADEILQTYDLV